MFFYVSKKKVTKQVRGGLERFIVYEDVNCEVQVLNRFFIPKEKVHVAFGVVIIQRNYAHIVR